MLDNERYLSAKKALVNLSFHPNYGSPDDTTFHSLLSEHYLTQKSLNAGAKDTIGKLFTPKNKSEKDLTIVHLIGMPRSGKSSAIKQIFQPLEEITHQAIHASPESAGVLKDLHKKRGRQLDFSSLVTSQVMVSIVDVLIAQKGMPSRPPAQIYVTDRGLIDLTPFTRANFLAGRMDLLKFSNSAKNIESGYRLLSEHNNAVIMFLIPPSISYQREKPEERDGLVMNMEFLSLLHEQYIRFHNEVIEGFKVNPSEVSFSYACLDMSGTIESNLNKVAQTFAELITPFRKNKTPIKIY